ARMLYEVRVAANKGLGLFAKLPIPRGTRILAEKPLVALRSGQRPSDILGYAKKLDEKSREQLLGLSWHPGSGIKRLGRWSEALGWAVRNRRTKAIDATMKAASSSAAYELALFPVIARINHSCLPNAQANYHPLHRTFNVHATRDIPAGEEVSINYLPEVGQLQGQRVAKLEEGYGFTCNCPACDLSTNAGKEGEQSRKETRDSMKETRADMPARERQEWLREREIEALNLMLDMYRREDIVGREVASIYYHLARLQSSGDAFDDALTNARVGLRLEEDCLGADHPEYLVAL
ncbi:SET domain-containing protein, partial [Bimuria novae-zelandiae CBS 107.79]